MPPAKREDWRTPASVFTPLNKEFRFTVDAAASPDNAMLPRYWTEEDDALTKDWTGERVWCNPPYGKFQHLFIRKAAKIEASLSVLLLPVRTDTRVWHECVFPHASDIRFLKGRVKFEGAKTGAPFPSAIVVYKK